MATLNVFELTSEALKNAKLDESVETKKTSKKKAEPVKEVEATAVEEKVDAVAEEPKKVEAKVEKSAEAKYKVISGTGIYTFKGPSFDNIKGKPLSSGSVVTVTEVKGNWGKIDENRWIILSSNLAKL